MWPARSLRPVVSRPRCAAARPAGWAGLALRVLTIRTGTDGRLKKSSAVEARSLRRGCQPVRQRIVVRASGCRSRAVATGCGRDEYLVDRHRPDHDRAADRLLALTSHNLAGLHGA